MHISIAGARHCTLKVRPHHPLCFFQPLTYRLHKFAWLRRQLCLCSSIRTALLHRLDLQAASMQEGRRTASLQRPQLLQSSREWGWQLVVVKLHRRHLGPQAGLANRQCPNIDGQASLRMLHALFLAHPANASDHVAPTESLQMLLAAV